MYNKEFQSTAGSAVRFQKSFFYQSSATAEIVSHLPADTKYGVMEKSDFSGNIKRAKEQGFKTIELLQEDTDKSKRVKGDA
jgi:hypothetical protein